MLVLPPFQSAAMIKFLCFLSLLCLSPGQLSVLHARPFRPLFQEVESNPKDRGITGKFAVTSADKNRVQVVEFLPHTDPKTPLFLLFHDGTLNRAEYRYIAPELNRMGFNCMAPDLRAGRNNLGHKNQTQVNAKRLKLDISIMSARQDMQAVITYARTAYPEAPILLMGCSYSASHALRLAGEMAAQVDGVVAFSPADIFESYGVSKTWIQDGMGNVHCPVLIASALIEKEEWIRIYEALPAARKHMFAADGGEHGVHALADRSPHSEEYWKVLGSFLDQYFPRTSTASEPAAEPDSPTPEAGKSVSLERMLVLGASVSMGFFLPANLSEILDASCQIEHQKVRNKTTGTFAYDSVKVASKQVEFAHKFDPTLLVAPDFLFWLGYGSINAQGDILTSEAERLELLETGLALLESLDCPLVVGDFPDMSHAAGAGYMIGLAQLPTPETLLGLNARLATWAEQRGRVLIVPLKDFQLAMNSNESFQLGNYRWPAGSEKRVLQADRLHPTLEGLAGLAHWITLELVRRGWSGAQDWDLDLASVLAKLDVNLKDVEFIDDAAAH